MTYQVGKCGSVRHFLTDFLFHPHEEAQLAPSFLETDKMTALKQPLFFFFGSLFHTRCTFLYTCF